MATFGQSFQSPRIVPLDFAGSQFDLYKKISKKFDYSFLFESLIGPEELAETSLMGFDPEYVVRGYRDKIVITNRKKGSQETINTKTPFEKLKTLLPHYEFDKYRYIGGAVGMINYDAIRLWEEIPDSNNASNNNNNNEDDNNPDPLFEFGIYNDGILYDIKEKKALYFNYGKKDRLNELVTEYDNIVDSSDGNNKSEDDGFCISNVSRSVDEPSFEKMVNSAKKYIHDGDIFQVVLSKRFNFQADGDYLKPYSILRKRNPSPYMYHLKMGNRVTVGSSPEMLLRITDDYMETFPIAGTRAVTDDENENNRLKDEMLSDEKELAEHTMLVDLGRNDIGRVCKYGSVRVDKLMEVKKFSHVQHMVSHVVGKLDKQYDCFDAIKAVFPAGTVSGAPKIRAMQIIDELEPQSRGPYAGAVGYFSFNGCCDFAISIRTAFFKGKQGFVQTGAGIVIDSQPKNEWLETEHKANGMLRALEEASSSE